MGYELSFYKTDLSRIESISSLNLDKNNGNEKFSEFVRSSCKYVNEIQHGSGSSGFFEKYLRTIAGDYFSEPKIYELCMCRNDIFPFTSDIEWGYLKLSELERFISSIGGKDKETYFEDNDDFEEDLDILENVFREAVDERSDLLCIYS